MVSLLYPDWLKSTSHKQLELEIGPLEESLKQYLNSQPTDPAKVQYAKEAQAYLERSKDALNKRQIQNAWALYYKAELLQYHIKPKDEVNARAGKILFESTNLLSSGAKQNVRRLIGQDSGNGNWD